MTVSIEFNSVFSANNNNVVIFVSNLYQLRNIDFPTNFKEFLANKQFVNHFKVSNSFNINDFQFNNNQIAHIKIFLIKSFDNIQELGANLYTEYEHTDNANHLSFVFSNDLIKNKKIEISDLILGFLTKSFTFDKYKLNTSAKNKLKLLKLYKVSNFKYLNYNLNLLYSINYTKNLVSEPANILNPLNYSKRCLNLKIKDLKIKVLNKKQLQKIGMRSLLGVSQGSKNEPQVVILEWNLKKKIKPTILVGKGVTFDTGGISIKTSSGMEEMITDMSGSAVVVGSMINAALNKSPKSIVGIIGLVENMPDGEAQRPGDIVKSLSGQTIEILNTDAEGRLVLADILTYIQTQYIAKEIIDFATLTGAIMIALGTHRAGLFSNSDSLSKKIELAGTNSGEKVWRLPLGDEYNKEINSSRADMKNIGTTRYGGSIHAAEFIQRFINDKTAWAHIDIAGVSWTMKTGQNSFSSLHSPGATAFGIKLIDKFLKGK